MPRVINLSVQFLFVHGLLWVFITLKQFEVEIPGRSTVQNATEAVQAAVQFAPPLAILFVGNRMRAL